MNDPKTAAEAKRDGIKRVLAVVIDGKLTDCGATGTVDVAVPRSMGLGVA